MKKFVWLILMLAFLGGPAAAQTYEKIQGYCEKGGEAVVTDGRSSTTKVQRSYPSCTITVYQTGTFTLASIASNGSGTPKSNPFTADSDGYWSWFALDGVYDVKMSGGGLLTPITRSGFWIVTSSGGGSGITGSGTTNRFPLFTSSSAIGNSVWTQTGTAEFGPSSTGKRINLGTESQQVVEIANAAVGGTNQNRLAKLTGAPSTAVTALTSDTSKIVGIVIAGAGTTGNAQIVQNGSVDCEFDGAATAGNYVGASTTLAGRCKDLGSALPTTGVQVIGRVLETIGSAGNALVYTFTGEQHTSGLGGSGTTNYLTYWTSANTVGASNILHDTASQINQSGYSFDISAGGLSELTLETDQVIIKGGVNRATSAHVVQVKGVTSQTGDYFKAIDITSSTKFRIRSTGQPSFGGVDYTFPALPGSTSCLQISSGGVISTVSCVTGAVPLQVQAYNVKNDGGCVGDGITDDTACVAAAYTAALAALRPLYFPTGTYFIDAGTISIATNGLILFGDGPGRTFIESRTAGTGLIIIDASVVNPHSITIRDLTLTGTGAGASNDGIRISGANTPFNLRFENLRITNFAGRGIYDTSGIFQSRIENVVITMASTGNNAFDLIGSNDLVLINNYVTTVANSTAAYRIHSGRPTLIGNNGVNPGSTNGSWGVFGNITAEDGNDSYVFGNFIGNNIEDFTQYGMRFKEGSFGSFYGNTFLAPSSGTVTPLKFDFVDNGQRGIWDAANTISTTGAAYTNGNALNSRGAPFIQLGGNDFTTYYDTNVASSMTFPYMSPQLVAGSTNIAMLTTRAQITALEASGLVGDLTGATDFTGSTSRILLQSGTAARPTFTFGTDTDTGFYNSAANTIGFAGGGASLGSLASTGLTLGIPGTTVGALILGNASNAFTTTIQSGVAAASRTYTLPTNFGAAGTVLTDAAGNGTLSWATPTASAALTATYVGYGDGSNLLTGTTDFSYNTTTKVLNVGGGAGTPYVHVSGVSDAAGFKMNATSVAGTQGGLLMPFVGGGNSNGPGIWWGSSASYGTMSGIYLNNGFTFQGASGTHDPLKIAEGTGTSSNGTVRYTLAPTSSLFTQNLSTGVTNATHDAMQTDLTSSGGAGGANLGIGHLYRIENASSSLADASRLTISWATATGGSETGRFAVSNNNAGGGLGDSFIVEGDQFYGVRQTANISGAATLDFRNGNSAEFTLTGNVTSTTLSNLKDGGVYWIIFKQDNTGSRTLASTNILTTGADLTITSTAVTGRTLFTCMSNGTNLYCSKALDIR